MEWKGKKGQTIKNKKKEGKKKVRKSEKVNKEKKTESKHLVEIILGIHDRASVVTVNNADQKSKTSNIELKKKV